MTENAKAIWDSFFLLVLLVVIIVTVAILWSTLIENSQFHHKTRVGSVVDVLAAYEDCKIDSVLDDKTSTRGSSDLVTLKCVK